MDHSIIKALQLMIFNKKCNISDFRNLELSNKRSQHGKLGVNWGNIIRS